MTEYIEREFNPCDVCDYKRCSNCILHELAMKFVGRPAADVVPVVHGRWIYHECVASCDGAISGYSCSECNAFVDEEIFDMDEFHKDFCGNCGARMDGE